jgi:long-chain acyl-CoA synthetase
LGDESDEVTHGFPPQGARALRGPGLELPAEAELTVPRLLLRAAGERAHEVALRVKRGGVYRELRWRDVLREVRAIALGLHALGVRKGDRVAIAGDPLPEWMHADYAAQCMGAVSYGLYPTCSADEAEYLLRHGGAKVLIVEDQEFADKVLPLLERLPDLRKLVVIDAAYMFGYDSPRLMSLAQLVALGRDVHDGERLFRELCDAVRPQDPAAIVYTSGTSAHPKGALYRHRNLVVQGHQFFAFHEHRGRRGYRSVVHLPLNHLYERMNTLLGPLTAGVVPHFGEEVERFTETLYEVAPQHHASVPRYWAKLASRVVVGIESSGRVKRAAYALAMRVGRAYRHRRWAGRRAPLLAALYLLARLLVFDRMLKKLGLHRVRVALSSGAPLPAEVQALWQIWGVNLKNIYGQTEGGVIAAQFDRFPRPATVGTPYPLNEVRLADDGEVVARGPGHFSEYWNDPEATAAVLQADGIHTGDVGTIDADGQLRLVDRKKDILITAGGKNISPSRIETLLKSSPYISEVTVIGDGRKYLTALIEIDVGTVSEWARTHNVIYAGYTSLATHPRVYELIGREVERYNAELGRVERIKAFRILDRELDPEVEGEPITPTRKVKRAQMQSRFGYLIEQMYRDEEQERIEREVGSLT